MSRSDQWPPHDWLTDTPSSDFTPISLHPCTPPPSSTDDIEEFDATPPPLPREFELADRLTRRPLASAWRCAWARFAARFRCDR